MLALYQQQESSPLYTEDQSDLLTGAICARKTTKGSRNPTYSLEGTAKKKQKTLNEQRDIDFFLNHPHNEPSPSTFTYRPKGSEKLQSNYSVKRKLFME